MGLHGRMERCLASVLAVGSLPPLYTISLCKILLEPFPYRN